MPSFQRVLDGIWELREGLFIGALAGIVIYYLLPFFGVQFSIIPTEMSLYESLTGGFSVNRSLLLLVFLGMIVGAIIDANKKYLPNWLARWF